VKMLSRTFSYRKPVVIALAGATLAISGPPVTAHGTKTSASPQGSTAQAGCVLKLLRLRMRFASHGPPKAGPKQSARTFTHARFMTFESAISCSSSTTWKVTMQIRRRRTGPDKTVAQKQFSGTGSDRFIIGADCKEGQSFNGNFTINIFGGPSGGITTSRVIKNKKC
jgi:hypothetical protein